MAKLDPNQVFDFDKLIQLQNAAAQGAEALMAAYKSLQSTLDTANSAIEASQKGLIQGITDLNKATKALDVTLEENQKTIVNNSQAAEQNAKALDELEKQQKANEKLIAELNKEIQKLTKSRQESKKSAEAEEGSLKSLNDQLKESRKERDAIAKEIDGELNPAYVEAQKRTAALENQVKSIRDENRLLARSWNAASGSIVMLRTDLIRAQREFDALSEAERDNAEVGGVLQQRIEQLNSNLLELEQSTGRSQRNVGNYASAFEGLTASLTDAIGGGTSGISGVLSSVAGSVPQAAAATAAIGALGAAYVELASIAEEVNIQLRQTQTLTNLNAEATEELTADIRALTSVFDVDFNETLRAANTAINVFNIEGTEATASIARGLIEAQEQGDQLVEAINEYGANFQRLGFSFDQTVGFLSTSVQDGAFTIDRAGDIINNAAIELQRLDTNVLKDILGEEDLREVTKIVQDFQRGTTSGITAIEQVTQKIIDLGINSRESGELLTRVFTAVGEEGIDARFIESLTNISSAQENLTGELNEYQEQQLRTLRIEQELADAEVELAKALGVNAEGYKLIGTSIRTFLIRSATDLIELFKPLLESFQELGAALQSIFSRLKIFNSEALSSISAIDILTIGARGFIETITQAADAITFLINGFNDIVESSPFLTRFFDNIANSINSVVTFIREIPATLEGASAAFSEFVNQISIQARGISNVFQAIRSRDIFGLASSVEDLASTVTNFGSNIANAFNQGFEDALNISSGFEEQANEVLEETGEFEKKLTAEQIKAAKERRERLLEAADELNKSRIDLENEALQEIIDNDEKGLQERFVALRQFSQNRIRLAQIEKDALLRNEELLADERTRILEEFNAEVSKISKERISLGSDIIESSGLEDLDLRSPLEQISEDLDKGIRASNQRIIDSFISTSRSIAREESKRTKNLEQETQAREIIQQAALDFTLSAINGQFEAANEARALELEALNIQQERELALAGESESAKQAIREEFDQRQRELQIRQARAEKRQALFQVAIDTALAISKAIAQFGPPPSPAGIAGIAAASAIGLFQAAAIASQTIPQFEDGGHHKGGLAIINEKGIEMHKDKSGRHQFFPQKGPLLVDLPAGEIFNADDSKKLFFDDDIIKKKFESNSISKIYQHNIDSISKVKPGSVSQEMMEAQLNAMKNQSLSLSESFEKSVSKLPINIFQWDDKGFNAAIQRRHSRVNLLNKRHRY